MSNERSKDNGICALCDVPLTWYEKLNSKVEPKCCYPCWKYTIQSADIEYGQLGYLSKYKEMYMNLLEEKNARSKNS
jgi:hypothetical protein